MKEKINEYIERFFSGNDNANPWVLIGHLKNLFGLDMVEAYGYVSKYLSKRWEVN